MHVYNIKKKRNVLSNSNGFTLLELLFSISVTMIILVLVPFILLHYHTFKQTMDPTKDYEWNLFVLYFNNDLENVSGVTIYPNRIFIDYEDSGNKFIEYERYRAMIRRKVGGKGHEPALLGIEQMRFYKDGPILRLEVTFVNGLRDKASFMIGEGMITE